MVAQLASMRPVFSSFSAFFQAFSWRQTYLFHSRSSMHRATTLHRLSRPVMKTMFVTFFIVQLFSYFGVSFFPSSCKLCERSGFSLSSAAATRFYSLRDISDGPKYSLVNSKEHSRLFNNNFNFMVPMFGTEVSFIASRAVATHLHYGALLLLRFIGLGFYFQAARSVRQIYSLLPVETHIRYFIIVSHVVPITVCTLPRRCIWLMNFGGTSMAYLPASIRDFLFFEFLNFRLKALIQ